MTQPNRAQSEILNFQIWYAPGPDFTKPFGPDRPALYGARFATREAALAAIFAQVGDNPTTWVNEKGVDCWMAHSQTCGYKIVEARKFAVDAVAGGFAARPGDPSTTAGRTHPGYFRTVEAALAEARYLANGRRYYRENLRIVGVDSAHVVCDYIGDEGDAHAHAFSSGSAVWCGGE